jgi:hypothetical protein
MSHTPCIAATLYPGMAVDADVPQPTQPIDAPTGGTELLRYVNHARVSSHEPELGWRDGEELMAGHSGVRTGYTERLGGQAGKRLRGWDAARGPLSWRVVCGVRRGLVTRPRPRREPHQSKQREEQERVGKQVRYHGSSPRGR